MPIIDLSHTINSSMPVYPGDPKPFLSCVTENNIQVTKMSINVHTGTHIDLPLHFFPNADSATTIDLDKCYGNAYVIDCTSREIITPEFLKMYTEKFKLVDFMLFYTGWDKYWHSGRYFENFPVLSEKSALLLSETTLKGVGFDALSADPINQNNFCNHKILLGKGKIIIENLANLSLLLNKDFRFSCFPLKIDLSDGSPVRAVAYLD